MCYLYFFPVWVAFVGSTVSQDDIIYPPIPLVPGPHLIDNYANALFRGGPEGYAGASQVPVIRMLFNSAVMAFGIALEKLQYLYYLHLLLFILDFHLGIYVFG